MRKLFLSYARENKAEVEQLQRRLDRMGYGAWFDGRLYGGNDWWNQVLDEIARRDAFIAIVSRHTLASVACHREREWARRLGKPIIPLAVESVPKALPSDISETQIIDLGNVDALETLVGTLNTLPPTPALPDPMPERLPAPLSYLTELIDLAQREETVSHDDQHQIVRQISRALHSNDPAEREGGRDILAQFGSRADLFADVYRLLEQLKKLEDTDVSPLASPPRPQPADQPQPADERPPAAEPPRYSTPPYDEPAHAAPPSPMPAGDPQRPWGLPPPQQPSSPRGTFTAPPPPHRHHQFTAAHTNKLAPWSLISSLAGILLCLPSIVGVVLGFMALKQINKTGEGGRGLAIAGIAVGTVVVITYIVLAIANSQSGTR